MKVINTFKLLQIVSVSPLDVRFKNVKMKNAQ